MSRYVGVFVGNAKVIVENYSFEVASKNIPSLAVNGVNFTILLRPLLMAEILRFKIKCLKLIMLMVIWSMNNLTFVHIHIKFMVNKNKC